MTAGWLYDGERATRYVVEIEAGDGALRIIHADGRDLSVPAADLVHIESRIDAEVYGRDDGGGWRLGIMNPHPPELAALLPRRRVYGRWIDRIGLVPAVVAGLVLSATVILFGQFFPHWVAPLVPRSWERSFGDALVGDFGEKFCTGAGGQEALAKLGTRLSPRSEDLRIRVVSVPIVNAAALPGGTIVIFNQLLKEAKSPDEVAGVLAHEIGHVENRDVTEAMIRHFGFSLIIASVGGTTGGNVEMLTTARYSRRAETRADGYAIEALDRAGISPRPTADFFERLARIERAVPMSRSLVYLASHPLSEERRERFAAAAAGAPVAPSLTSEEWRALVHICDSPARTRPATTPR
jgi:Zn-dependent protease with chaperone function